MKLFATKPKRIVKRFVKAVDKALEGFIHARKMMYPTGGGVHNKTAMCDSYGCKPAIPRR